MKWKWEKLGRIVLNARIFGKRCNECKKIIKKMCRMWENCVTDVMNKKMIKRWTERENIL